MCYQVVNFTKKYANILFREELTMHRVLVVEDEINIAKFIKINLEKYYETITVYDGESALDIVKAKKFSVIILDIMLPDINGFEVLRTMRSMGINVPVIMLTAKSQDVDKVCGLELGADDYITKPFNPRELVARVKAVVRRVYEFNANIKNAGIVDYREIRMDFNQGKTYINGSEVNLTPREFQLLRVLIMNRDKVIQREELLDLVWGNAYDGDAKTLDVHIRRLREKIEKNPDNPRYIHTQWGVGYYFGGN